MTAARPDPDPTGPDPHGSDGTDGSAGHRRTLDETRDLLIATGAEMVRLETPVTIGHIDLIDVCRRAGLTTAGSAYKIWPNKDAYRVDLLRHVLETFVPGAEAIEAVTAAVKADPSALPELPELLRTATLTYDDGIEEDIRRFSVYVALWLAAAEDAGIAADLTASDTVILDAYTTLYDEVVQAYDLEWVPPLGPRLFAAMAAALSDGLLVRAASQSQIAARRLAVPSGDGEPTAPWSLLGCGILALTRAFTRPRSPSAQDATDPTRSDAAGFDPTLPDPAGSDPTGSNPTPSNPAGTED